MFEIETLDLIVADRCVRVDQGTKKEEMKRIIWKGGENYTFSFVPDCRGEGFQYE